MSTNTATENNQEVVPSRPARPSFFRRLGLAIRNLLILFLKLMVIVAIILGGWVGFNELQRSFNVVNGRISRTNDTMSTFRSEQNQIAFDIATQSDQLEAAEVKIEAMSTQIATNISDQQMAFATLEAQATEQALTLESYQTLLDTLSNGLITLQEDDRLINTNIDELGGEVDQTNASLLDINARIDEYETQFDLLNGELATLQETLITSTLLQQEAKENYYQLFQLFRIWELIARARLHLAENNLGRAQVDIQNAMLLIDILSQTTTGNSDTLATIQQRLTLTAASLPDAPNTAVQDLDNAWTAIDSALDNLLLSLTTGENADLTLNDETALITPTPQPESSGTPEPTATVLVEATGTPEPTATSTP